MLRRAVAADADAICDLFLASRRAALAYLPQVHSDDETRRWLGETLMRECDVWIAMDSTVIVGFMALAGGTLEQLYVHPDHVRRSIGTRLLAQAKKLSPRRLSLFTFQRNTAARAFYEAHGFVAADFNDGSRNEEGEPDMRYVWQSGS